MDVVEEHIASPAASLLTQTMPSACEGSTRSLSDCCHRDRFAEQPTLDAQVHFRRAAADRSHPADRCENG